MKSSYTIVVSESVTHLQHVFMPCALSFENNHGTLDNYAATFELVCSVSHISHFIIIRELHGDKNSPPPHYPQNILPVTAGTVHV